ncbi:PhoX family phosphatase [Pontibacterium granulatum]|uniref:PhoX family protein n=1 Tax=Pontibacterium granulatum TaxID=2036029 RepID=UPI00249C9039|nr:PhoX family phosphatase [Pontibacterium granulatum]MDI3325268.1 PhoX family phosphatase [Pontibacterium granulatum]
MLKDQYQGDADRLQDNASDLETIVDKAVSRRGFLRGGAAAMGLFLAANPLAQAVAAATKPAASKLLGFSAIPASTADTFVVPEGYNAQPLISWGDPILRGAPAFDESGTQNAAAQAGQFGDNTDGMSLFPLSEDRALLAVNNEYTNYTLLFDHKGKAMTADDVKKAQAAHGVSVFEIKQNADGSWSYLKDSAYNRRITANTDMELTGPAAGHDLVKTKADPTGKKVLGTFNNCANGQTPWGTYLTCEENFNGYFSSTDENLKLDAHQKRYGIKAKDKGYQWSSFDARFDLSKESQEANRHGWVVEIDPFDPNSTPKKRTALGRFKHENAALTIDDNGHVVVYLGDDERGEHLYKFVSKGKYNADDMKANRNLLEEGTLFVARFNAQEGELKGKGEWVELTHGKNGLTQANGFEDQASVMIFAREAATQVGATTMDRPEWVAVHPNNKVVCCTLTNNKHRGKKEGQPVGGPNPRIENKYGQILRWWPANGDHTAAEFDWDLLVIAGNPTVHSGNLYAGSTNISEENMFNSPDGIGFDQAGRLWIQTDGNYSNAKDFAGMGNNQMLCADPQTGEIRRFATGPVACEITGLTFSPDQRTMFVGIQHPGEKDKPSHFPAGGNSKPRSTIMVVRRNDGGIIGA